MIFSVFGLFTMVSQYKYFRLKYLHSRLKIPSSNEYKKMNEDGVDLQYASNVGHCTQRLTIKLKFKCDWEYLVSDLVLTIGGAL